MKEAAREVHRQLDLITKNVAEIVPPDELADKLASSVRENRPLRVKYGIDPTTENIHIGHLVPCRLLRLFQDLGHVAVLIIGDYTARIGDPTGRGSERRKLSPREVEENMWLYSEQLFRVVDSGKAEIHHQSAWLDGLTLQQVFELLSRFSVAQMMAHETFRNRMDSGGRLSLHELMYPVMQAYDSIQVHADIEIGGTDQRFNCLCGRDLQRAFGVQPQVVVTVPLLMGTDGRKMSKTSGNYISTDMAANEIVGKVMSISDDLMPHYVMLATDWQPEKRLAFLEELRDGARHPRDAKLEIARNIASQIHGVEKAREAVEEFVRVFSRREKPDAPQRMILPRSPMPALDVLLECAAVKSKSEGRRLIAQGGVRVDGRSVGSYDEQLYLDPQKPLLLKVGKRRYFELFAE